jgi:hypothetical protein
MRIVLNGSPGDTIFYSRGLRQGDPLSPMLFILVIDVLGHLVMSAEAEGLLQSLTTISLNHRIFYLCRCVVLFLRPLSQDICMVLDILQLFGDASGLRNNVQKSSVFPIQCGQSKVETLQEMLPCEVSSFPCKYLGEPLSLKKLPRSAIQSIIDRIAAQLPGWKADLMNKAGRRVMVQSVLTGMIVYLAMAIDLPQWALKAIDKIRKCFLWRGRKEARGGHCAVAWGRVCRPIELGGLGFLALRR